MFHCSPDDPILINMDPVQKLWMFHNWIEDQNEDVEILKNHAYLLASFWNPEAVKKLTGEGSQQFSSTDEEFEQSTQMIDMEPVKKGRKRSRKKILKG